MRTGHLQHTFLLAFVLQGLLLTGTSVGAVPLNSNSDTSESSGAVNVRYATGYGAGYYGYGEGNGNENGEGIRGLIRGVRHHWHGLSRTWFGLEGSELDSDSNSNSGLDSPPSMGQHSHSLDQKLDLDRSALGYSGLNDLRIPAIATTALDGILGVMGKMVAEAGERMRMGLRIPMPARLACSHSDLGSASAESRMGDGEAVRVSVGASSTEANAGFDAGSGTGSGSRDGYDTDSLHDGRSVDSEQVIIMRRSPPLPAETDTETEHSNSASSSAPASTSGSHSSMGHETPTRRKFTRRRRAHP